MQQFVGLFLSVVKEVFVVFTYFVQDEKIKVITKEECSTMFKITCSLKGKSGTGLT